MSPELIPLLLAWPLLGVMAVGDLRRLRISNRLILCLFALFVVTAPMTLTGTEVIWRFGAAMAVFVLCFAGFAAGLLGGGDVKALGVLMLFIPASLLPAFPQVFAVSMMAGILCILGLRRVPAARSLGWDSVSTPRSFPMGVSIALSGILMPFLAF